MKFLITTLLITGTLISGSVYAGNKHHHSNNERFYDSARVIHSVPIYRTVRVNQPRQQCYEETVHYDERDNDSYTPMIAGGVLGGIVGNQFGKGNGKTFMTIAGTVLGGSVGRDIGMKNRHRDYGTQYETRCETVNDYHEEEVIEGYRVTYKYHGKKFTTTLPYDPGRRIKVRVSVRPAD